MEAICKWFDDQKGYGFLMNERYNDIYIHFSQIRSKHYRTLVKGERVRIGSLIQTAKGYQAKSVETLDTLE